MASNLVQRTGVALVAIPAALGVVYLGGWALTGLLAAAAALGARELYALARHHGVAPLERAGLVSAMAVPVLVYLSLAGAPALDRWGWLLGGLWIVGLLTLTLARRAPGDRPLAAAAVTLLGVLYPAGLASFLLPIRHATYGIGSWPGTWMVFFPLVLTWVCDTAAMFGGRWTGGPKLWPSVSPGKTWSGSLWGLAGAVAAVPLLNALVLERLGVALPTWQGVVFALVLGVVGQVGDLAESLFKREAGVKDSSSLIPGHGGVLDRFDSLYFVLPVAAALYRVFGRL